MRRLFSGFLALVLLSLVVLPALMTPAAAAAPSRYCVLVLDTSGEEGFRSNGVQIYTADTAVEHVKTAAMSFLKDLLDAPGNNYVALVTYTDTASTLSGFTDNIASLQRQVNGITEGDSSRDIAAGLLTAKSLLDEVEDVNATKNVVLFTTGMTDSGKHDETGFYDDNVVGNDWYNSGTGIHLYAYANKAIEASAQLKEMATVYTLGLFQTMAQIPEAGHDVAEFFRLTAKDLASSEDCFFDAADPSALEFAFEEIAEDITIEPKLFKYAGMIDEEKDTSAEYYYHDNYFFKRASLYNPSLATMSLCLELSTWSSHEKTKWYDPQKPNAMDDKLVNVKTLLMGNPDAGEGYEGIGFHNFAANDFWEDVPEMNSIGVCAAQKTITSKQHGSYTLIAVAVRGGGYYSEWGGNLTVGDEGAHTGFAIARDEVIRFVSEYISDHVNPSQEIKLWLVGFSRAGAVANMVAGQQCDSNRLFGPDIDPENVFCYTFEAPQGVLDEQATGSYRNIHNILNANDLVPLVAPSSWGFVRYNHTNATYLPTRYTTDETLFTKQEGAMKQELSKMGFGEDNFTYKITEYSAAKKLVVDKSKFVVGGDPLWSWVDHETDTQTVLREGVDFLADDLIGGREYYAENFQYTLSNALSIITHYDGASAGLEAYLSEFFSYKNVAYIISPMFSLNPFYSYEDRCQEVSKRTAKKLRPILEACAEIEGAADALGDCLEQVMQQVAAEVWNNNTTSINTVSLFMDAILSSDFQAHYPEICLAWCRSLDPNYNTDIIQDPSCAITRVIRINCPVDVFVYDENDQQVASIVSDVPAEDNLLICYLNENGEKILYLPGNGDYRLDIQATGEGEVHYSVGEYSFAHGQLVHLENYYDIPISDGDALVAQVPAASRDSLKENAITGTDSTYRLEKNGTKLYADDTYSGEEKDELRRTVTVTTQGNGGYATGSGSFAPGSMAQAEAFTLPNGTFLGWHDEYGTLLSSEAVYRFPVQEDHTITAFFSEITYSELTLDAEEGGRIKAQPGYYPEDVEITLLAVPDRGYEFVGWKTNEGDLDDEEAREVVLRMPDEDVTVTAQFKKIKQTPFGLSPISLVLIGLAVLVSMVVTVVIVVTAKHSRKS